MIKLSPAQKKVFDLKVNLLSNKEIASILNIGEQGVKFHVTYIYKLYKVKSLRELLIKLQKEGDFYVSILEKPVLEKEIKSNTESSGLAKGISNKSYFRRSDSSSTR